MQAELDSPKAVLHNPLTQKLRVIRYPLLQPSDFAVGVVEWNSYLGLTEVHDATKPVWRLLVKIVMPQASAPFFNDPFNMF